MLAIPTSHQGGERQGMSNTTDHQNAAMEKMLNDNPLMKFSVYTNTQARAVGEMGEEIKRC